MELAQLLQQHDVEDDATSPLKELPSPKPKPEPDLENFDSGNFTAFDLVKRLYFLSGFCFML